MSSDTSEEKWAVVPYTQVKTLDLKHLSVNESEHWVNY